MKENNKFMFLQNIDYSLQIVFMLILFSMLILQILNRFKREIWPRNSNFAPSQGLQHGWRHFMIL